jgi:hypothetical protein
MPFYDSNTDCGLPPHTAERLRLSAVGFINLPFPEAEPQEKFRGETASGKAEPYRSVRRQSRKETKRPNPNNGPGQVKPPPHSKESPLSSALHFRIGYRR